MQTRWREEEARKGMTIVQSQFLYLMKFFSISSFGATKQAPKKWKNIFSQVRAFSKAIIKFSHFVFKMHVLDCSQTLVSTGEDLGRGWRKWILWFAVSCDSVGTAWKEKRNTYVSNCEG